MGEEADERKESGEREEREDTARGEKKSKLGGKTQDRGRERQIMSSPGPELASLHQIGSRTLPPKPKSTNTRVCTRDLALLPRLGQHCRALRHPGTAQHAALLPVPPIQY
eukprot:2519950-Rhodomonas_salina.1